jgi:4-aminobutyrate aminotransferase/(S)-3-amino-2-methylpropionate transaminase
MQAMEFVDSSGAPSATAVKKLVHYCLHHGVLVLNAGTYDNIVRLLMPLTITDEEFNQALEVIEGGLSAVAVELGELTAVE